MQGLSYCAHEVYEHDRDLFLRSLFVPSAEREKLLSVYALVVELDKIHGAVSEEMIGHIRYAWWQESIEALYARKEPHGHPILEALFPIINFGQLPEEIIMQLLEQYRNYYPELPPERVDIIKTVSLSLIKQNNGWLKADHTITKHRLAHGKRLYPWLIVKLLTVAIA